MKKVLILGSTGLVGSNLLKKYKERYPNKDILSPPRYELNLTDTSNVLDYFATNKPDLVFLCAAKVGGIKANNDYKANFITQNLRIQTNVIEACHLFGVKKLVFLGSSCIYPKECPQPIKEEYLLTGPLEPTNDAYAVAKIAGIKMCQAYNKQYNTNYISLMPTNAYGPNDNYHPLNSHFFPALIKKAHECKEKKKKFLYVWGSGNPLRELIFVDDIADACVHFIKKKTKDTLINIGTGKDMRIKDYVNFLIKKLKLNVKVKYDSKKPDGVYRKVLDVKLAQKYGWKAKYSLSKGFDITYKDFLKKNK